MKKLFAAFIFCINALLPVLGQSEMTQSTRDNLNYGNFTPNPQRTTIYGIDERKSNIKGDVYLDSAWHVGEVFFYPEVIHRYDPNASDSVGGYKIRVEVVDYTVEFLIENKAKAVEESAIRRLVWMNGTDKITLVNTRQYGVSDGLKGYFELLSEGKLTILKYTRITLLKPTYNIALDIGEKDYRILQKSDYYYLREGKNSKPEKFKFSKSSILDLMKDKKSSVEKYVEAERLNLKQEADLRRVLQFYNAN